MALAEVSDDTAEEADDSVLEVAAEEAADVDVDTVDMEEDTAELVLLDVLEDAEDIFSGEREVRLLPEPLTNCVSPNSLSDWEVPVAMISLVPENCQFK